MSNLRYGKRSIRSRIIEMKEKTDRSGAYALRDRCLLFLLCVRFFQFFSDQIKRGRPDIQNELVESFLGKFSPQRVMASFFNSRNSR